MTRCPKGERAACSATFNTVSSNFLIGFQATSDYRGYMKSSISTKSYSIDLYDLHILLQVIKWIPTYLYSIINFVALITKDK